MQSPTLQAGSPEPARRKRRAEQDAPEPFNRLESAIAEEFAAAAGRVLSSARERDLEALRKAREDCREALLRLHNMRPELELWRLERAALPERMRDVEVRLFGLPRTRMPFSPSDCWANGELDARLRSCVRKEDNSGMVSQLARLIDRYIQCDYPAGMIEPFYRRAVELLVESGGPASPTYLDDLISHSRVLVQNAGPFMCDDTNPYKLFLHKSISSKTGVPLTQNHPASFRNSFMRLKKPSSPPPKEQSLSDELGIPFESSRIARSISGSWELDVFDRFPAFSPRPRPRPIAEAELLEQMTYVMRDGTRRSHPELHGIDFTEEECRAAAAVVLEAQRMASAPGGVGTVLPAENERPLASLRADERFVAALANRQVVELMELALTAVAVEARASQLHDLGEDEAFVQARQDVQKAVDMAHEYIETGNNATSHTLQGVREMIRLSKEPEHYSKSPYELALTIIEGMREKRISLVTIRPPFPELMPPPPSVAEKEEITAPDMALRGEGHEEPAAPEAGGQAGEAAPGTSLDEDPAAVPVLGFPFGNDSAVDAELEKHLPERVDDRTALIRRTARNLRVLAQVGCTPGNAEHAAYVEAVAALQPSFTYDSIVGHATIIVDREMRRRAAAGETRLPPHTPVPADLQAPAEPKEETQPGFDPSEAIFAELNAYEKSMLSSMMKEECTAQTVSSFRALHPGIRELLFERSFASSWSGDGWRKLHELYEIRDSICGKCGIPEATAEEKREAISDPTVLSQFQISVVASVVGKKPLEITADDIRAFGVWASSDPMTPEGRAALQAYADKHLDGMRVLRLAQKAVLPDSRYSEEDIALLKEVFGKKPEENITRAEAKDAPRITHHARKVNELRSVWLDTPPALRAGYWKSGMVDVLTAGSLLHKLRFDSSARLSREEADLLEALHLASAPNGNPSEKTDIEAVKQGVADNLTNHTYRGVAPNPYYDPADGRSREHLPMYTREIIALSEFGEHMLAPSLKSAAHRQAEYLMLLDFLGVPADSVSFRLEEPEMRKRAEKDPQDSQVEHAAVPYLLMDGLGASVPKIENGRVRANEDSFASARVVLGDGSVLLLDMVADGMGGHSQGENGGKKNGQVASGIAKEMFELAAAAGWLRTPEDVRRLMLSVDMAIVMEQIRKKPHPDTELAENNMGTTMSVNIQRGCDFWTVHCGDSLSKVLRGGNAVFSAQGHSSEYLTRLTCRQNAEDEITGLWKSRGVDPIGMDPRFRPEFERQVAARAEELLAPVLPKLKKNEVCSVLGVLPKFVHINNSDSDPGPMVLQRGDRTLIGSDGLEAICDHEYHMIAEKHLGDIAAAAEELTLMARGRPGIGPHQALCGCTTEGKREDDKTLIMREAEAGFAAEGEQPFQWFKKRIWASPREFASSASLRMILETCSDQRTDSRAVMDIIDALIDAAPSAPAPVRKDAFTVAIYSIFSIVARRDDREELLSTLVPKIGGWSGLIMKKLRTAPNSGPHKLAMVDFLHMCVPEGDFYPLTGAKNREIALRAGELFSGTAAPPEALEAARQEWPKPIFPASSSGNGSPYSDLEGNPLPPESTRYLDSTVVEIYESTIVQDTAKSLGVLPRDLEIMLFYAYAGAGEGSFDAEKALDPHDHSFVSPYKSGAEADDLVAAVSGHLCATLQAGADSAQNMLICANLVFQLNEAQLTPEVARSYAQALWHRVGAMDPDMPYYDMFANRARSLAAKHGVSTS